MTHLHLQIVLANTQWARPGQMWPSWPKRAAARLSWRRAATTDYVERKLNVWMPNKCNMPPAVLMLAGPVSSTVTERRGWRAAAVLGSDRCLNVIGRQLRLSIRKRCPVDQSKVKNSEELLLQPMGGDHAFSSCPPTDADKSIERM